MRNIIYILLVAIALLTGCSAVVESADKKAPGFSLQDINDRTVRLSDYENHVVILNFFATWCPACISEIPDFIELMNKYGDKGFVIIGISVDRTRADEIRDFAVTNNINYPVLIDNGLVSDEYGPVRGIPATFIIDKKGNIVQQIVGAKNKDYFEEIIKPLL